MHINLVAFSVPFPPNYGGAIDVFYKIKALAQMGHAVHLHCFEYGDRPKAKELEKYCTSVYYYPRKRRPFHFFSSLPFIVQTRKSSQLITNLKRNNYPILFEGLHCTYPLYAGALEGRYVVIRTHNIEHRYYSGLAKSVRNPFKKWFFAAEAAKLERYESVVGSAHALAAISASDREHFERYGRTTELITPFHPFSEVEIEHGSGNYILIHGDLSVPENVRSVKWLIQQVVSQVKYRVVIAGKSPEPSLVRLAKSVPNIEVFANPNDTLMNELVTFAHINLIHSFYPQGFKLKLLHALYCGRFCITNTAAVAHTNLSGLCTMADTPQEFIDSINSLMSTPFEKPRIKERKVKLAEFSNEAQAKLLLKLLGH